MDTFSTSQVAKRFGVADQTVKNWAAEFAPYLSPTAIPEPGKKRAFTADDVSVLALVHELVGRGRDVAAAHAALQAGQRGANNALTVAQTSDNLIVVQQERDRAQGAVVELRRMLDEMRTDFRGQIDQRDQRIVELERELARAQLRLEMAASNGEKPPTG